MEWIYYLSDNAHWVGAPITSAISTDEILEGVSLYRKKYDIEPDSYIIKGQQDNLMQELLAEKDTIPLKYNGSIIDDSPTEVLIYHSSCSLSSRDWSGIEWYIWDSETLFPWVSTNIDYSNITAKVLQSGIEVYNEEHKGFPNTLVINPYNSEILFKLRVIAEQNKLSIYTESGIDEDEICIINLPSGGGGETIDEEDLEILELLKSKKAA